jgi:nicotinamidase-related amidase
MNSALVLLDIQNDYFPGGNMVLQGMEEAAARAKQVLERFRILHLPVFHIKHVSLSPDVPFMSPNTHGVEINEKVLNIPGEAVIEKYYPNAFRETALFAQLKTLGVYNLVFCGAMSHMCVDTTVRAAFDLGFNCTVIEDACATMDLVYRDEEIEARKVHAAYMAALSLPFAKVVTAEEFLQQFFKGP